ncbi:MAG: hypothetical protein ACFFAS_18285 [Promethearchaeota archaeon]
MNKDKEFFDEFNRSRKVIMDKCLDGVEKGMKVLKKHDVLVESIKKNS